MVEEIRILIRKQMIQLNIYIKHTWRCVVKQKLLQLDNDKYILEYVLEYLINEKEHNYNY